MAKVVIYYHKYAEPISDFEINSSADEVERLIKIETTGTFGYPTSTVEFINELRARIKEKRIRSADIEFFCGSPEHELVHYNLALIKIEITEDGEISNWQELEQQGYDLFFATNILQRLVFGSPLP